MPTNFSRATQRFAVRGLQLAKTIDQLRPEELSIAQNIRQFVLGELRTRPGLTVKNASALTGLIVHSIRRLNNDLVSASQASALVVGNDTRLDTSNAAETTFTNRATGFSGNPLSLIPFRPDQSPEPLIYVGDSAKSGKVNVAGTFQNMGIAPPTAPPTFTFPNPARTVIDAFTSAASWSSTGLAGTGALKLATTISIGPILNVLYDTGSTGWCSVVPTATYSGVTEGNRILTNFGGGTVETTFIERVLPAITTTTVQSISYDASTTGLCTIVLAHQARHRVQTDALIKIDAEVVRVLAAPIGDDDRQSIRCSTTINHVATEVVTGLTSIRTYYANTHAAAETLSVPVLQVGCTSATPTGIATITRTGLTLDLSQISGRPVQDTDEMFFAVRVLPATEVSEVQILLDCGDATFTQDFFMKSIKASDFTTATTQQQTTTAARTTALATEQLNQANIAPAETPEQLRQRLQLRLLKAQQNNNTRRVRQLLARLDDLNAGGTGGVDPSSGTGQSADSGQSGSDVYWVLRFRVSDLTRIGSNASVGLKNINAIRINAFITGSTGVGDPLFQFSSWWVGGTFGPDVGIIGTPYTYRFTYRSSTTGARSNPSPHIRDEVNAKRQRVQLTGIASSDAQVDKIDWYRFGGSLNDWHYIGTGPNTTAAFNDDFPDDVIAASPLLDFSRFQPFPIVDIPRTGVCNAAGTTIDRTSGDNFNVSWAPGGEVIVGGISTTIYRVISTTKLEVLDNLGTQASASFFIPEATIQGQPLPAMWGPFGEGQIGAFMFACGAVNQPGTLFWTNGNDPDSADESNTLEITSPSEPLMNGCVYDGRSYVWSTLRQWAISMEFDPLLNRPTARVTEVPNGKGLFARFALAVGPKMWFVAQDGIYETIGGEPQLITADLYPLFPHDGQPGSLVNAIVPPDFTLPNSMKLAYADGMLYYDYVNTSAARRTLVYNTLIGGWTFDVYTPTVASHYQEEGRGVRSVIVGGSNGKLYSLLATAATDDGTAISCAVRSGAFDAGDFRADKRWSDLIIDYLSAATVITPIIGFNDYNTLVAPSPTTLPLNANRIQTILDIVGGEGQQARNIVLDLTWSGLAQLYGWEPSWAARPEDAALRATENDNLGYPGAKFVQGIIVEADTANVAKAILVQADNGANNLMTTQSSTLSSITHNGRGEQAYSFAIPFIAHEVRFLGNDTDPWKLFNWRWVWEPSPELVRDWITQPTTLDSEGFLHLREVQIAHISTSDLTFSVTTSDGVTSTTDLYTITHGGGVYRKTYVVMQPRKFKSVIFSLTSAEGFRLFVRDLEYKYKSWGSTGPYIAAKPMGDLSRLQGAAI